MHVPSDQLEVWSIMTWLLYNSLYYYWHLMCDKTEYMGITIATIMQKKSQ